MVRWDPQQYLQFAEERARPFVELMRRVLADDPSFVVDLGCGPGNLTAVAENGTTGYSSHEVTDMINYVW